MKYRAIGKSKLKVSSLGLGCWGMSGAYGEGNRKESIATIREAFDLGVTFIDTADVYGFGHNEELVAEAINDFRDKVVLATKFGFRKNSTGQLEVCGRPNYVKSACEASLKRLNTDCIDLYYLHRLDKSVPIEETIGAVAKLIKEGKVKHIGLSEVSATTLAKADKEHPITAVQSEYSLITRDIEESVIPYCVREEIGIIPFCPLGRGLLTGALQNIDGFPESDYRADLPRYKGENFKTNQAFAQKVIDLALEIGLTPGQLALSWLLHQNELVVPIPGMKTQKYLKENLDSVDVELSQEHLSYLNQLSPQIIGDRYQASNMDFLDFD